MTTCVIIQQELDRVSDKQDAQHLSRFFKTGPGSYGEGDLFRGIRVPHLRKLVKRFSGVPLVELIRLLDSPYHEDRLFALLAMVDSYKKGGESEKASIYKYYLSRTPRINNWDLVDLSAHHIVGDYLFTRSRKPLYRLARSSLLWDRRISLIATFHFIRNNDFNDTLDLISILQRDQEDLIHKAMGWMLREIGKRDREVEEDFLKKHLRELPRTTLRYAIERFPQKKRLAYLKR